MMDREFISYHVRKEPKKGQSWKDMTVRTHTVSVGYNEAMNMIVIGWAKPNLDAEPFNRKVGFKISKGRMEKFIDKHLDLPMSDLLIEDRVIVSSIVPMCVDTSLDYLVDRAKRYFKDRDIQFVGVTYVNQEDMVTHLAPCRVDIFKYTKTK